MMFTNLISLIQWYLRPFIKWFLRRTTHLCELQRICYGQQYGAPRSCALERSLELSHTREIQNMIHVLDKYVQANNADNILDVINPQIKPILKVKNIDPMIHVTFPQSFAQCLKQLWSYKRLLLEVEALRETQYDNGNLDHEAKLTQLWYLLVPNEKLESRITKQWQYIGFQGDDPKTDFRGMGLLGLENLLFFSTEYPHAANQVLSHSLHPKYGYTYAIVGINITSLAYNLLKEGLGKTFLFNSKHNEVNIYAFQRFYCFLLYEFDASWVDAKPKSIMEFSHIFDKFNNIIRKQLADPAFVFRIKFEINIV